MPAQRGESRVAGGHGNDPAVAKAQDTARGLIPVAVTAAGPMREAESQDEYLERVRSLAYALYMEAATEKSHTVRRLSQLIAADGQFVARVEKVEIDEGTGRGLVRIQAWQQATGKQGPEELRTPFLNTAAGQDLMARAKALVGHFVVVFKAPESRGGRSYRTLAGLYDLGEAGAEAGWETSDAAPAADPAGNGGEDDPFEPGFSRARAEAELDEALQAV